MSAVPFVDYYIFYKNNIVYNRYKWYNKTEPELLKNYKLLAMFRPLCYAEFATQELYVLLKPFGEVFL